MLQMIKIIHNQENKRYNRNMDKKIRFVIDLDETLRDRLKMQSIKEKRSMVKICTQLIEEYLEQKENQ